MLKLILKILAWAAGIVVLLLLGTVAFIQARWDAKDGRTPPDVHAPSDSASIARGEYIFKYQAQCWGCHGTSDTSGSRIGMFPAPAGGQLFDLTNVGPGFGKFWSRNITPDKETGIGAWTDGEIVQAIREGVRRDRTRLFPIMPVDWYHGMADDDVLAVVAYLRSIPPVIHKVTEREPSLVARGLFAFNVVKPKEVITGRVTAPERRVSAEYGRYVSNNLADCADCHTPRNLQDGHFYMDSLFAGSSITFGGGELEPILVHARNITVDHETGIGRWTEDEFLTAVTTGMRPDSTTLVPQMPYAYYKSWDTTDIRAIYAFLKTVPAIKRTAPPPRYIPKWSAARGIDKGRLVFAGRCQPCHGGKGRGAIPTNVRLREVASSLSDAELKEFIGSGQMNVKMPPFGKTLTPDEMTALVAYIRSW